MSVEPARRGGAARSARGRAVVVLLVAAALAVLLGALPGGGAQVRYVARPQCTGLPPCVLSQAASGSGPVSPSAPASRSASAAPSAAVVPPPAPKGGHHPWYDSGGVQALGGGALAVLVGIALLVLLRPHPERAGPVARHAFPTHALPARAFQAHGGPPTVVDPPVPDRSVRDPAGPDPVAAAPAVPRPAELHRATVATDLHPQGYVEIDDCLYRAVWSEPGEPAPDPGQPVEVGFPEVRGADRDADVLLAFPQPQHPHRRHDAR
ncbi:MULTISPECIES: hypothetical protein [Streptacidiphilus]|uniref:Uncharacterized protein n=1 Tax=Streptacidiphilus cavernicola TaxID=3342716 RepID=A0ABV6UHZ9_9ACTN|nr:hypothetical protein [Streptacidiphilus jeojiense]